jgi:hypothetical protein
MTDVSCIYGVLFEIPTKAGGVMLQSDDRLRWTYSTIHSALNSTAYMHMNTKVEHLENGAWDFNIFILKHLIFIFEKASTCFNYYGFIINKIEI